MFHPMQESMLNSVLPFSQLTFSVEFLRLFLSNPHAIAYILNIGYSFLDRIWDISSKTRRVYNSYYCSAYLWCFNVMSKLTWISLFNLLLLHVFTLNHKISRLLQAQFWARFYIVFSSQISDRRHLALK